MNYILIDIEWCVYKDNTATDICKLATENVLAISKKYHNSTPC